MKLLRENPHVVQRVFVGLIAVLTVAWGVTFVISAAQDLMLDFVFSFVLTLVVMAALWWAVPRTTRSTRWFMQALALAWTLNIVGNVAWSLYVMTVSQELGIFTWVDLLYIARYVALLVAFWRFPRPTDLKQGINWGVVAVSATAIVWMWLFRPALASVADPMMYFLGGALYPIMDAVLVYAAAIAWAQVARSRTKAALILLALSMLVYGIANWINFGSRVVSLAALSDWASVFWLLADVLTGAAALYLTWPGHTPPVHLVETTSAQEGIELFPYFAGWLVAGLVIGEVVLQKRVDWTLVLCALLALGGMGFKWIATNHPAWLPWHHRERGAPL